VHERSGFSLAQQVIYIRKTAEDAIFRYESRLHPTYVSMGGAVSQEFLQEAFEADSKQSPAAIYFEAVKQINKVPLPYDDTERPLQLKALTDFFREHIGEPKPYIFEDWLKEQKTVLRKWSKEQKIGVVDYAKHNCVPRQADWVTFLADSMEDKVSISWTDGLNAFDSTYYRIPCWWGRLIVDVGKAKVNAGQPAQAIEDPVKKVAELMKDDMASAVKRIRQEDAHMQVYGRCNGPALMGRPCTYHAQRRDLCLCCRGIH
jgi:hypothetical protein